MPYWAQRHHCNIPKWYIKEQGTTNSLYVYNSIHERERIRRIINSITEIERLEISQITQTYTLVYCCITYSTVFNNVK